MAGGLIGFVLTAAAVVARRGFGHQEGIKATQLERMRSALESERVQLTARIRDASSRPRLVPIAERRLGMHLPSDSQVVFLRRQARTDGPR